MVQPQWVSGAAHVTTWDSSTYDYKTFLNFLFALNQKCVTLLIQTRGACDALVAAQESKCQWQKDNACLGERGRPRSLF